MSQLPITYLDKINSTKKCVDNFEKENVCVCIKSSTFFVECNVIYEIEIILPC